MSQVTSMGRPVAVAVSGVFGRTLDEIVVPWYIARAAHPDFAFFPLSLDRDRVPNPNVVEFNVKQEPA